MKFLKFASILSEDSSSLRSSSENLSPFMFSYFDDRD
jgi:hypothetical protein